MGRKKKSHSDPRDKAKSAVSVLLCLTSWLVGWGFVCFGLVSFLVNGLKQKKICIRELSKKSLKRQIRMSLW